MSGGAFKQKDATRRESRLFALHPQCASCLQLKAKWLGMDSLLKRVYSLYIFEDELFERTCSILGNRVA